MTDLFIANHAVSWILTPQGMPEKQCLSFQDKIYQFLSKIGDKSGLTREERCELSDKFTNYSKIANLCKAESKLFSGQTQLPPDFVSIL